MPRMELWWTKEQFSFLWHVVSWSRMSWRRRGRGAAMDVQFLNVYVLQEEDDQFRFNSVYLG